MHSMMHVLYKKSSEILILRCPQDIRELLFYILRLEVATKSNHALSKLFTINPLMFKNITKINRYVCSLE